MRSLFDLNVAFFKPLWRRVAVVAVCLGWALFELATGSVFWGVIFGGVGLFAAWQFFVTFDPDQGSSLE
ncbi:hypothetical protein BH23PSE1_BH23PSE1_00060 [soil metagenome]